MLNYLKCIRGLLFVTLVTTLAGCWSLELAMPFKQIATNVEQDSQYLVVVTYTQYKADDLSEERFDELVDGVLIQLEQSEGLYGYSMRRDFLGTSAWTYTIWRSEADMLQFKTAQAHSTAMQATADIIAKAKFARTLINADQLPYSWPEALELVEKSKRSYDLEQPKAGVKYY